MEENKESSSNGMPILDITDHFSWRRKMKAYLKKFGIWEIVINPAAPSNKKGKSVAQKEAKKDNTTTLKLLMDGLLNSVKGSVLQCMGEHFIQVSMVQFGEQVLEGKTKTQKD